MTTPNQERRSERSRQAILEAALALCREQGLSKTTMEEIAKRAQVGKQTIYRWWSSKAAVVQEALNEKAGALTDFPDTGDLLADLRTQMTGVAALFASPQFAPYVSLIAAAQDDPAVAQSFLASIVEPRVRAARERLRRAQQRGQLRGDVSLDDVIELLYAPLYYRLLLHTRPVTPEQVDGILHLAFTGLRPGDQ
ncbi:MAG TPA: TetR/AcrR family transcriptional regulator [Rugosimonospora sp.]|jgi:AcrR family transcriptional regulator